MIDATDYPAHPVLAFSTQQIVRGIGRYSSLPKQGAPLQGMLSTVDSREVLRIESKRR